MLEKWEKQRDVKCFQLFNSFGKISDYKIHAKSKISTYFLKSTLLIKDSRNLTEQKWTCIDMYIPIQPRVVVFCAIYPC